MARWAGKGGEPLDSSEPLTAAPQPSLDQWVALSDPARAHRAAWHACLEPSEALQPPPSCSSPAPQGGRGDELHSATGEAGAVWPTSFPRSKVKWLPRGKAMTQTWVCFLTPALVLLPPWSRCPAGTVVQGLQDREGTKPETLWEHEERWGKAGRQPGSGQRSACTTHFV